MERIETRKRFEFKAEFWIVNAIGVNFQTKEYALDMYLVLYERVVYLCRMRRIKKCVIDSIIFCKCSGPLWSSCIDVYRYLFDITAAFANSFCSRDSSSVRQSRVPPSLRSCNPLSGCAVCICNSQFAIK